MPNRYALAGENIALRARFIDDVGQVAIADNVYVHIFAADVDTTDLSNALSISGLAVPLGQGIYEYQYAIPPCSVGGTWHDRWEGELTCQTLDETLSFTVIDSGTIESLGNQLYANNLVMVTVSGVTAEDGTMQAQDHEFQFMTMTSPSYSNWRKVQLEAGGFIAGIPADTIQMAILEASVEADVITFNQSINSTVFLHARRQYVSCAAARNLLSNMGIGLKAKSLGDFSVTYDTQSLRDAINKLEDCMAKWEPQIMAGGYAATARAPAGVVKGELDPERPIVSRSWESSDEGTTSFRMPAANTRERVYRRYNRTFSQPARFKKWW